ncbi:MAG TPA: TIM-barrel domain-containing protein [Pseudacidobacterium sp.]|nr:TIM-barrel domain-containing protein [Pseudacidobacterium sp.]
MKVWRFRKDWRLYAVVWTALAASAQGAFAQLPAAHQDVVIGERQENDAIMIQLTNGLLRIKPCIGGIARVTYVTGSTIRDLSNPALADSACSPAPFSVHEITSEIQIAADGIQIAVNKNSSAVCFSDGQGNPMLAETDSPFPRSVVAAIKDGQPLNQASVWFALAPEERLYGLGQHQTGLLNQRNTELVLSQDDTNISIPFFLSSKGYGVLWNSASVTDWNNRFKQVVAIRSNDADAVDYYFIAGPSFDKIIAGYRRLSGAAPLFPRWAYGYWQSKLAYASTDQLIGIAAKYRRLHIPIDNIVLDAGWETEFGSRTFTAKYPDPEAMVQRLHAMHMHLMVSIWPLFQPGNANFDEMSAKGYFVTPGQNALPSYLPGARLYDAFNEDARKLYWEQAKKALYDIGVDAFWMDSTEPADFFAEEHGPMLVGAKTALGDGSKYANLYPLMTTIAIHDGQRQQTDGKRVFILTRSAFTSEQRNAAATWSGDTLTTFDSFRRQIPAGLNYSMTGLPYWTTDIGGLVGGDTADPSYRELFMRWFEYGAFCPVFRTHGARKNNQNELWSFGPEAQRILTLYDRLRYRLMPYIYAVAAKTTFDGYTPMRALVFDFAADSKALDINDEFMFGPSLLVAPVTEQGARSRDVYLPKGTDWYDFWTGKRIAGGQKVHRNAPLGILPLYVRAGSILPLGREEEYTDEYPNAPVELRVYPGADGDETLYYDDGMTYGYEKGQYSWVPMRWSNASRMLTVESQRGQFAGDAKTREFDVTVVSPGHGIGVGVTEGGRKVTYRGAQIDAHF